MDINVKKEREKLGLSQQELAGLLGVSQQTVSHWETGVYKPGAAALLKLIKLFGLQDQLNELL